MRYRLLSCRSIHVLVVLATIGLAWPSAAQEAASAAKPPGQSQDEATPRPNTPAEALARLLEGNQRFIAGTPIHPDADEATREGLVEGQRPFATILGCSDSRVSPSLVFDQGLGDLFVVRVAGNVVDSEVAGSIEYAVDYLGTRLMIVLGHQKCGAVTDALRERTERMPLPPDLGSLLHAIEPALAGVPTDVPFEEQVADAVEANVRLSVRRIVALPDVRRAVEARTVEVRGAVYDLKTGRVRFLD